MLCTSCAFVAELPRQQSSFSHEGPGSPGLSLLTASMLLRAGVEQIYRRRSLARLSLDQERCRGFVGEEDGLQGALNGAGGRYNSI
jgi:hypothetical protein